MWLYLRDVFIVIGVILIAAGVFFGWVLFAIYAMISAAFVYCYVYMFPATPTDEERHK